MTNFAGQILILLVYSVLASLPGLTIHSWLTALQTERFQQKAEVIAGRLQRCNNNWEDAFFITLSVILVSD